MTLPQSPNPTHSREDPPHLPPVCSEAQLRTRLWVQAAGPSSHREGVTAPSQLTLSPHCFQSAFCTKARQTGGSHSSASRKLPEERSGSCEWAQERDSNWREEMRLV